MNEPKLFTKYLDKECKKDGKYPIKVILLPIILPLTSTDYVTEGPLNDPYVRKHIENLHPIAAYWINATSYHNYVNGDIHCRHLATGTLPPNNSNKPLLYHSNIPFIIIRQVCLKEKGDTFAYITALLNTSTNQGLIPKMKAISDPKTDDEESLDKANTTNPPTQDPPITTTDDRDSPIITTTDGMFPTTNTTNAPPSHHPKRPR